MSSSLDALFRTLPAGWQLCRLKSVADIRYGLGQPPAQLASGVAMVRATDVSAGTISTQNLLRVDPTELPLDRDPYLKANEIIVVRSGAYTGDSAIVPPALAGTIAGYDMVATVTRAVPHFVAYGLLSKYVLEDQLLLLTLRAAQPHLNAEQLGSIVLAMPPNRLEQQRIAAYLDASCASIDAAVAAKRRQLETLDAVRESIIEMAVTRGLNADPKLRVIDQDWIGLLPTHWVAVRIKRVISQLDYGISVSTNPEGTYPVLKMGNIQAGEIVFSKMEFVDEVADELLLENNDLLYNRTNSPDQVGKAALFLGSKDDAVTFASYLVRLRANHRIVPEFLNYAVNSGGFLAFARRLAIPSVQQSNLNSTRYGRMLVPLPPVNEQRAICERLDAKLGEMKRIVTTIEAQISTLTAYRKSLIHECVTGQWRVTEADIHTIQERAVDATQALVPSKEATS